VVYAWLLEANVYTTAALLLWPWRRTSLVLSERGTANPRNRVGYRLVASVLARRAQALVANSPAGVSFMRTMGVPEGKLRLVPNGVPTARAAADPARVAALREELRLPARAKLVLNAGRLFAQKDHATLLRAFRQVRQEQPEAVLAIAGAGDLRASLEALTQDLGLGDSVRWLSERDDVPDLLALAELAVLSSADGEGLSNFLIEALLAGRRVVGTDVGSTADIIAGTDGVLVPSRAPECLAEAMVRALSEGDSASAQAARRASAHERFGEDAYVRKSERALMEALGEAPSKDRYV
jgi:glycosyltransferase involved in cell wall biosynthesis